MPTYQTQPGERYPFGATADANGVNFSIFSRHAERVELLLFEEAEQKEPFQIIALDPYRNCTFFSWHIYVKELPAGSYYTWRVFGPDDPVLGRRFNPNKQLVDPWARAVSTKVWDRKRGADPLDDGPNAIRGIVLPPDEYDWEGDQPLNYNLRNSIIYEVHVGGFTRDPSAEVRHPGTFAGLIEKIPYLKSLGITHVELLPVMAFDEQDVPPGVAARGNKNYWGYSTHSFFAPHPGYCVSAHTADQRDEFRDMVKALHQANIGVILDVVFNHTAEAGFDGPFINFRGMMNEMFYHLDPEDRTRHVDYTGCGNTVNCNHPLVARFIIECLEYWVQEMHVDGFRFDLASVLARGEDGAPMYHAPLLWNIEFSNVLAHTKLIAEAWDAGGLYQVGDFPGFRWAEWNGRYRDVMRRFVRGDPGLIGEVATRLAGSSDLYEPSGRLPINGVNFITCHDGFTLQDLVSYNSKHNYDNGQDNEDGSNDNLTWNCGIEGETDNHGVRSLRRHQTKNFVAILLMSQGVPMLLAGDEFLRSQHGNNNAYCQDNPLGWVDWKLVAKNEEMYRFTREMIAFRKRHDSLMRQRFFTGRAQDGAALPDISWHGVELDTPQWRDPGAQLIAFTIAGTPTDRSDLHLMLNMSSTAFEFALPQIEGRFWYRAIDTALPSPNDIVELERQRPIIRERYLVEARSVAILENRPREQRQSKERSLLMRLFSST